MNTPRLTLLTGFVTATLCLGSCAGGSGGDRRQDDSASVEDTVTVPATPSGSDTAAEWNETRGRAGDGTSMHSLELLTGKGDTLYIFYENNAIGGITSGDLLDVVYKKDGDNELAAQTIVNLTSLAHVWSVAGADRRKHIELDSHGNATVYGVGNGYDRWTVDCGRLVLYNSADADTFDISLLTDDSLILADVHKDSTIRMKRKN